VISIRFWNTLQVRASCLHSVPANLVGRTSGFEKGECPEWVDNGLTVVPIADVHAHDSLGRMISAAVGHNQQ